MKKKGFSTDFSPNVSLKKNLPSGKVEKEGKTTPLSDFKSLNKQIKNKENKSLKQLEEEQINFAYLKEQIKMPEGRKSADSKRESRQKNKLIKSIWGKIRLKRQAKIWLASVNIFLFFLALILWLPPFRINEIEINGLNKIDKEKLLTISGIQQNQHILSGFGFNLEAWLKFYYINIENNLKKQFTEIEDIRIYPSLPSKIVIDVKERVPIAYLSLDKGYAQIDKKGVVMKLSTQPPEYAPIIEGFFEEGVIVGEQLTVQARQEVGRALLILNELIKLDSKDGKDFTFIPQIEVIRILNQQKYLFQIRRKEKDPLFLKIKLDNQMQEDLNWFVHAIKQNTFERLPMGLIDISGKNKLFMPIKNIFPYDKRYLELDQISAISNPIILAEDKEEKKEENKSANSEETAKVKPA